ncbi:MAG: DPP IV N-terminal domain-containing protein [Chloroflexi bacterium]|nr:DPP IV N-terminal domain-containing protein [Chloroflexota bacterium]
MSRPFDDITIEQVARYPRPGMTVPAAVRFTPDGAAITYLHSAEGSLVRSLWRYEIATGDRTVIAGPSAASTAEAQLSREEELRRERTRMRELGVTSYAFAPRSAVPVLLVPEGGGLTVSAGGGPLAEVPGCEGALDPHLSDDGTRVAFVRGGELWVADVPAGNPRRLTSGACDGLTNGLADFIAQEELDQERGFWWSPDGTRIAFIQADSRHIPVYPIVHQGKDKVEIEPHRYPFAGQRNAVLRLGVATLETDDITWADLGSDTDIYVPRVAWRPDGVLTAEILSRDQKQLRLLAFDGPAPTVLVEEHGEPWVNLSHDTRFLKTGEIVRSSERTGFRHLYLHAPDGRELRALTGGDWTVIRLIDVDEPPRRAYFVATREGAAERHVYSVSLDGGDVERLTSGGGWHSAVLSPDGARMVHTWSSRAHAPRVALCTSSGEQRAMLSENAGATAEELGLQPPELVTVTAEDGTLLHGAIYRPPSGTPAPLPAVVSVYGGPHAQRVVDDWAMTVDMRAQYLARRGFLVFVLDNRGSANRGLAFEAPLQFHMGDVEVRDQVAGVRWLAAAEGVDPGRVGIYGWSYGGYMTCMALMCAPEVFQVGVAGAPVTDWDGYDTGYTERYMGTPKDNPAGYRESSVLAHVDGLRGKLLIVHGMIDENVHFRHTARLMVALATAQKPYDLLVYPEERHMPRDAKGLEYQERRVLGYFEEHL